MKKVIIAIALTITLGFGINSINAEGSNYDPVQTSIDGDHAGYTYIRVYEDGAIWVYIIDEDGTFIGKYLEEDAN